MAIVFRPVGTGSSKPGGASNPRGENTAQWDVYGNNNAFTSGAVSSGLAGITNASKGNPSGGGSTGGSYSGGSYSQPAQQPNYFDMLSQIQAQQQAARDQAYSIAADNQKRELDYSTGQVNQATDNALQEAYINKMMTLKNLPQNLSAQGLTGGVAESTTAGLYNNYGNARNALETERINQLGALQQAYNNNMAQLEAERAGGAAASLSELTPYLLNLVANNPTQLVSMQQGTDTPIQTRSLVWDDDLQKYVYR